MSYEIIRSDSIEALQEMVNEAIYNRGKMPVAGVAVELRPIREKISESQVVHSIKIYYSQAVMGLDSMAGMTNDLVSKMEHQRKENEAMMASLAIPPRPRKKRKTKKR